MIRNHGFQSFRGKNLKMRDCGIAKISHSRTSAFSVHHFRISAIPHFRNFAFPHFRFPLSAYCLPLSHPGTRIHATSCPGEISLNSGSICAHCSIAIGQRVRKRQPDGGLIGVGTSPCKVMRLRFCFGSGIGIADSNACV